MRVYKREDGTIIDWRMGQWYRFPSENFRSKEFSMQYEGNQLVNLLTNIYYYNPKLFFQVMKGVNEVIASTIE